MSLPCMLCGDEAGEDRVFWSGFANCPYVRSDAVHPWRVPSRVFGEKPLHVDTYVSACIGKRPEPKFIIFRHDVLSLGVCFFQCPSATRKHCHRMGRANLRGETKNRPMAMLPCG